MSAADPDATGGRPDPPDTGSSRPALPSDPGELAPMGAAFDDALAGGLEELGLTDARAGSPAAIRSYEAHARLLRAWNEAINLTAIRQPAEVARRHVLDSLGSVPTLQMRADERASLLDLGSGGGYPGLPLAAALSLRRVSLLDSVRKKARFMEVAAAAVGSILAEELSTDRDRAGTPFIEVIAERAEDVAEEPDGRASWDIVTARAVGSLAEVVELAMPLTRERGVVVVWKREDEHGGLQAELRDAGSIIRATGGGRPEVIDVGMDSLPGHRLVLVPKERPTPSSYPRPPARRRGRTSR